MECEGDGGRTGAGKAFVTREVGETGADLVVWRGIGGGGKREVEDVFENGIEDKRSENEGESLPAINFFLSASVIFLVARLASNFSVRNFSYNTSFVLTFSIYKPSFQNRIKGEGDDQHTIMCVDSTAVLSAAKSQ